MTSTGRSHAAFSDCGRAKPTVLRGGDHPQPFDVLGNPRRAVLGAVDRVDQVLEKAQRRGKIGWTVGRRIQVAPHYRRPHMALVWIGRGRAVPRVVPRRASVVHRKLGENVPSGFGGGGSENAEFWM